MSQGPYQRRDTRSETALRQMHNSHPYPVRDRITSSSSSSSRTSSDAAHLPRRVEEHKSEVVTPAAERSQPTTTHSTVRSHPIQSHAIHAPLLSSSAARTRIAETTIMEQPRTLPSSTLSPTSTILTPTLSPPTSSTSSTSKSQPSSSNKIENCPIDRCIQLSINGVDRSFDVLTLIRDHKQRPLQINHDFIRHYPTITSGQQSMILKKANEVLQIHESKQRVPTLAAPVVSAANDNKNNSVSREVWLALNIIEHWDATMHNPNTPEGFKKQTARHLLELYPQWKPYILRDTGAFYLTLQNMAK